MAQRLAGWPWLSARTKLCEWCRCVTNIPAAHDSILRRRGEHVRPCQTEQGCRAWSARWAMGASQPASQPQLPSPTPSTTHGWGCSPPPGIVPRHRPRPELCGPSCRRRRRRRRRRLQGPISRHLAPPPHGSSSTSSAPASIPRTRPCTQLRGVTRRQLG
jgi:hypothetical protein